MRPPFARLIARARRPLWKPAVRASVSALALAVVAGAGCATHGPGLDYPLIQEAWDTIEQNYVQRSAVESRALTYAAMSGMVDELGDTGHSTFLTPQMAKLARQIQSGQFKGIGITIESKEGRIVIVSALDGSPAQKAGLKPGDIIVRVSGKEISHWPISRVVETVTGPAGTPVTLTVRDPRLNRTRQVTIVRATIKVREVAWQRLPGTDVAHLRITRFDEGATQSLRKALTEILNRGLGSIILDVRNNPGGLLDEAVGVASQFLRGGAVLEIKNAKGEINPVPVRKGGVAPNIRLAVLIDQGSASAAEIVAAALQAHKRAILVGEPTFGTGTVLGEFRLSDGSALLLAIEEWLTPDGRSFWHKGVTPDVAVTSVGERTPLSPEAEGTMNPSQLRASGDVQLLWALDWLQEGASTRTTAERHPEPGQAIP